MTTAQDELRQARLAVWDEARHLVERVAAENRVFTADEQAAWDRYTATLAAYDRRIAARPEAIRAARDTLGCRYCRVEVTGPRCSNCGAPVLR